MIETLIKKFATKKMATTISGFVAILLTPYLPWVTADMVEPIVTGIFTIVASYNVGQGIADGFSNGKTSSTYFNDEDVI